MPNYCTSMSPRHILDISERALDEPKKVLMLAITTYFGVGSVEILINF